MKAIEGTIRYLENLKTIIQKQGAEPMNESTILYFIGYAAAIDEAIKTIQREDEESR